MRSPNKTDLREREVILNAVWELNDFPKSQNFIIVILYDYCFKFFSSMLEAEQNTTLEYLLTNICIQKSCLDML